MFVVSSSLKNFHSFIQKWNIKSSELLFQYSWRKNIKLVQVHQFKYTSAEMYSLLKASLLLGES